jgi:hypothetical protein
MVEVNYGAVRNGKPTWWKYVVLLSNLLERKTQPVMERVNVP